MAITQEHPESRERAWPTNTPDAPTVDAQPLPALSFWSRTRRTLTAAALLLLAVTGYVASKYVPNVPLPLSEFFLAVTAAMSVHLLDRLWLFHDTEQSLGRVESTIIRNVSDETGSMIRQLDEHTEQALRQILISIRQGVKSMEAMNRSGVSRIYETREEAASDIAKDLTSSTTTKIRIIGISLNDFVLRKGPADLGEAWSSICERITRSSKNNQSELELKVLFIDPNCLGAHLRSMAEVRLHGYQAGRLGDDVRMTTEELLRLEEEIGRGEIARMYRTPPILFLVLTNSAAYVQQYYFWSTRIRNKEFPILRFQNVPSGHEPHSIHAELEMHFDWIWDRASIGLRDYHIQHSTGTDTGLLQSSLVNIYCDSSDALERMVCLLSNAHDRASIQGISLHSFFSRTSSLFRQLSRLLKEDKVGIDIMFLDRDCEQAKFRAYREFTFARRGPEIDRSEYFNKRHSSSTLFSDTKAAIDELEEMVKEITRDKGDPKWVPKLTALEYDSSPHCFILRVDGQMLVEQYHYGKLPEDSYGARIILGKDLPLFEYSSEPTVLLERPRKLPFDLLASHLDFVIGQGRKLPVERWVAEALAGGQLADRPVVEEQPYAAK